MKKLLLLTIILLGVAANARDLTTDGTSSREYLINHGHSDAMVDIIEKSKFQANGDAKPKKINWLAPITFPFKVLRGVHSYLDPALDQETFMNHEFKITPRYDDL
jgi:hypothetical protein